MNTFKQSKVYQKYSKSIPSILRNSSTGKKDIAIETLQSLLIENRQSENSNELEILLLGWLGRVSYENKDYENAIAWYEKVLNHKCHPLALFNTIFDLARALYKVGKQQEALTLILEKGINNNNELDLVLKLLKLYVDLAKTIGDDVKDIFSHKIAEIRSFYFDKNDQDKSPLIDCIIATNKTINLEEQMHGELHQKLAEAEPALAISLIAEYQASTASNYFKKQVATLRNEIEGGLPSFNQFKGKLLSVKTMKDRDSVIGQYMAVRPIPYYNRKFRQLARELSNLT